MKVNNQSGQSVMEYIIISSLIGVFCLGAVKGFGENMKDKIQKMENKINKTIRFNSM